MSATKLILFYFLIFKNFVTNQKIFKLNNISTDLEGIYKFKEPREGSEKDKFIIEFFGNKEIIIDNLTYQIAHYVLLKEKEASRYLIDKELFDALFQKI